MVRQDPIIRIANSVTTISLDTFDDRLRIQKIGYLTQELGADSGFTFDWYLHGPYSPSLTRMLYSADDLGTLANKSDLAPEELTIKKRLSELVRDEFENSRELELLASVWYITPKSRISPGEKTQLLSTLKDLKPQFKRTELNRALEKIIEFRNKHF